jgi:tetratricopeptide (TPR) repeat protein
MNKQKKKVSQSKQKKEFLSPKHYWVLILLFTFVLYGNSIQNKYSLDDVYVTNNEQVRKGLRAIPEIFTSFYANNVYEDGEKLRFGFRPVVKLSFAFEYALFGNNPHMSHLFNVLFYFMSLLLMLKIFRHLWKDKQPLFVLVVILLFMAHPLHTEVVSSLKNRDELLCFLFALGSLALFIKYLNTNTWYYFALAMLAFLIALFSKVSAIIFIAIIPMTMLFFKKANWRKILFIFLSLTLVFVLSRIYQKFGLPDNNRPKLFVENPLLEMTIWERIPTAFYIALFYLKMLIIPHPMRFYYGYNMIEVADWMQFEVILSIVVYLALLVLAIRFRKEKPIISFALFLLFLSIAMYSNLLRPAMGIVADRFLYVPSLSLSIFLALLIFRLSKTALKNSPLSLASRNTVFFMLMILLIPYAILTMNRNKDWYDQHTLLEADMPHLEQSAKANFIYAGTLKAQLYDDIRKKGQMAFSRQKADKIIKHLEQSIEVYPEFYQAWNMLGSVKFTLLRDSVFADHCYKKSLDINALYTPALLNLGFMHSSLNHYSKAAHYYLEAIRIKPQNINYYKELLFVYEQQNDSLKMQELRQKINKLQQRQSSSKAADFF